MGLVCMGIIMGFIMLGSSCVPELGMAKEWVKLKYSERGKPKSNLKPLMNYGLAVTMRMELKSCSKPETLAFLGVGCMSSSI